MNISLIKKLRLSSFAVVIAAVLTAAPIARGQYFNYTGVGDLMLGFRKPGVASYELVVGLGNITNFLALSPGTTIPINNYSPAQLTAAVGSYPNVQWSAFATFTGPPNSSWAGYKLNTIWFTLPRTFDANTQTTPPVRGSASLQNPVLSLINSIGVGARTISQQLVTTNDNNNTLRVREPTANSSSLSVFVGDTTDSSIGNFQGNTPVVENTVPSSFTSAVRSDLYQAVPTGSTDPNSGTSSGNAYYVGYFTFSTSGSMTFTRASTGVAPTPPAPQIVSITRAGNTSTVYFTTTNGAFTYSLRYTNLAGLSTTASNWPASPTTVVGNGLTNQLSDTTTSSDRLYRISVQ